MNDLDRLLQLQGVDLAADQTRRRKGLLPEREVLESARARLAALDTEAARLVDREDELMLVATESDRRVAELGAKIARLEGQLRNVVVVREAEALQHEIATISEERAAAEDTGLEALAEIDDTNTERLAAEGARPEALAAIESAADELARAEAVVDAEVVALEQSRTEFVAALPAQLLERYEALRRSSGGVAIARLEGHRCGGCHLDLSRVEVEELLATPAELEANCPSCGRILVRSAPPAKS
jgi:uncharacterized protein